MTLHNDNIIFSEPAHLKSSELPAGSDNSPWARARRSPCSNVSWKGSEAPSVAHAWLLLYVLFTVRPDTESLRLELVGTKAAIIGAQLRGVVLAIDHPLPTPRQQQSKSCSCWIPHLRETFSMVALDYKNDEHLRLFHEWQNDPRFSQGWERTGTLDQHREYLRNVEQDAHQVAILAKWDDEFFAYWAKKDRLGAYYNAGDFDRGRHSLVGDVRFRGPHRVMAWWSSLIHYLFLDDPRTMDAVGEPKGTNSTVIMYDLMHGFGVEHLVDLPNKSVFVRCPRGRFFQLCPLGGLRIGLVPKL
ncbi:hypothetical protein E4U28_003070 [Claviceps purpurea]|nr:hypothetical protein E4U28_003070 [Claviceps purpurea]